MNEITDLKDKLFHRYANISFDLSDWNEVVVKSSDVSVYHVRSLVDYYAAYYNGVNLSFIIYDDKKPTAVFPIFMFKKDDNFLFSVNGDGLVTPLFVNNTPKRLRKRIEMQIADIIFFLIENFNTEKLKFFESSNALSSWYLYWLKRASKDYLSYELSINLEKTLEEIRLNFRKSYKPLVNKALREWDVDVCSKKDMHVFEEFKLLHKEVSGRQTRNDLSWDIQKKQIQNEEALLITVRNNQSLIGGGFFNYSKDEAMYSVGAYNRDLFDKPIGHAVQMKAIEKLKELGCKKYNIGEKITNLNGRKPSEKEKSITHFKEGFASSVYSKAHIEISF